MAIEDIEFDPDFIEAVIEQESSGNSQAVGPETRYGTAKGLMQLIDSTGEQEFKEAGLEGEYDPFNSDQNRELGTRYLKKMYDQFGNLEGALSAYNFGPGNYQDYLEGKKPLPEETKEYVPAILARYKRKKGAGGETDSDKPIELPEYPEVISPTGKGFADAFLPVVSDPSFSDLSPSEKIGKLSELYNKQQWEPEVDESVKELSTAFWEGASPEEKLDLSEVVGVPPQLPKGSDVKEELEAWKNDSLQTLYRAKINPIFFGKDLDDYFAKAADDESQAYAYRESSSLGQGARNVGNFLRDIGKGGVYGYAQPLGGIPKLLGFEETANWIENLPKYFGEPENAWMYKLKDGYVQFNDDGTPKTKIQGTIAQGIGQLGSLLAGGAALKGAGFTSKVIGLSFGGINALTVANDNFTHVKKTTGDTAKAYKASLWALPAAAVGAVGQLAVVSNFINPALKGLSTYNKIPFIVGAIAKNAIIEGASNLGMGAIAEVGISQQTGEGMRRERLEMDLAFGSIAGGLFGGVGAVSYLSNKHQSIRKQAKAVEELQTLEYSLEPAAKLTVPADTVPKEVADELKVDITTNADGQTVAVKRANVIAEPAPEEPHVVHALEKIKEHTTPADKFELSHERGEILEASKVSPLTKEETTRLEEIDGKLNAESNVHDIKAHEKTIANALEENPEILPVRWDKDSTQWVHKDTGEASPFLKDILYPSEESKLNLEEARLGVQKGRFQVSPPLKPLTSDYTTPVQFTQTGEEMVSQPQVKSLVKRLLPKLRRRTKDKAKYAVKVGGRIGADTLAYHQYESRVIRIANDGDIPSLVHEVKHAADHLLGNPTQNSSPKVLDAFTDTFKTFYPNQKLTPEMGRREGLTMFMQNWITGQPVHKTLLDWWNTEIKAKYPEIHEHVEAIRELTYKYYNQKPELFGRQFRSAERPSKARKFLRNLRDPYYLAKHIPDQNYIYRILDKEAGLNTANYMEFMQSKVGPKVREIINTVVSDFKGNVIPGIEVLKTIVDSVEGARSVTRPGHTLTKADLADYLTYKRSFYLNESERPSGLSDDDIAANLKRLEQEPVIKEAAEKYYKWWDKGVLDIASERSPFLAQRIQEQRALNKKLTGEEHGYYVPFSREFETAPGGVEGEAGQVAMQPFKKYKGSYKRIEDPISVMEHAATTVLNAGQRRNILDYLVRLSKQGHPIGRFIEKIPRRQALAYKGKLGVLADKISGSVGKDITAMLPQDILDDIVNIYVPEIKAPKGAEGTVVIPYPVSKGKIEFYEVNPDILQVFDTDLPPVMYHPALSIPFNFTKRVLQTAATTFSFPFQVANFFFRDFHTALLNDKTFNPLMLAIDMGRMLYDQIITGRGGKLDTFTAFFSRLGVHQSTRYGSEQILRDHIKGGKIYKVFKHPMSALDLMENFLSFGERATRMAVAKHTIEALGIKDINQPISTEQAIEITNAYQRSTVNFNRRGKTGKIINYWVPFFSARIAELTQTAESVARNPKRAAMLGLGYMSLGIANVVNHKDEDWFKETEPEYRTNSYIDTVEDDKGVKRLVAYPLSTFAQGFYTVGHLAASHMLEEGILKPDMLEYMEGLAKNMAPLTGMLNPGAGFGAADMLPVPFKIGMEQIMNKKFWNGRQIVPEGLKYAPPTLQYTANTSELSKAMASGLGSFFGETKGIASPMRLDHVMRSFLPGPVKAEAWLEKQFGIKAINEDAGIPSVLSPLMRGGYASSLTDRSHNKFYDALNEARAIAGVENSTEKAMRLKLQKVATHISNITKVLSIEEDSIKRDEFYKLRQDLFKLGISIAGGSEEIVPTLSLLKSQAKKAREEDKKRRSEKIKKARE